MAAEPLRRQPARRSRRDLLRAAGLAAGGATALLPACGDGDGGAIEPELPNLERDVAVLSPVLDQEYSSLAAYDAVIGQIDGEVRSLARLYRDHERRHADRLAALIRDLGATPPALRPLSSYASGFPPLRSRDDALRFAVDVEETAIDSYLDAMGKLSTAALRAEAATIVTTEAEQLAVLRLELGLDPVPVPFVGGDPAPS